MISPLAYIHPEAVIGEGCEIGPFCYIDKNVVIGKNNHLMNSVTLLSGARIGDGRYAPVQGRADGANTSRHFNNARFCLCGRNSGDGGHLYGSDS